MCKANFKTWVIIESVSHSGGYSTAFIYNIKISTKYKEQNFSSYFACRVWLGVMVAAPSMWKWRAWPRMVKVMWWWMWVMVWERRAWTVVVGMRVWMVVGGRRVWMVVGGRRVWVMWWMSVRGPPIPVMIRVGNCWWIRRVSGCISLHF